MGNNCLLFVTHCNKWWGASLVGCERVFKCRWSFRHFNPGGLAGEGGKPIINDHSIKILYHVSGRDGRRRRPLLGGAHSNMCRLNAQAGVIIFKHKAASAEYCTRLADFTRLFEESD